MKYKITIEEVLPKEDSSNYEKTNMIFQQVQVVEDDSELFITDIVKAINGID